MSRLPKRRTVCPIVVLTVLATLPISLRALGQSSEDSSDISTRAIVRNGDFERYVPNAHDEEPRDDNGVYEGDEAYETWEEAEEHWEEEDWNEELRDEFEEGEHEEDQAESEWFHQIEMARRMAELAESQPASVAFAIQLVIESTDEQEAAESLEELLTETKGPTARRLISLQLTQLYADLDQTSKMRQRLLELCR